MIRAVLVGVAVLSSARMVEDTGLADDAAWDWTETAKKVRIEFINDYEERLPPCYWQRNCGSSYEAAPGATPRTWRRDPLPDKRWQDRSPGAYRPRYEYDPHDPYRR
jgi:hypothetical protein